MLIITLALSGCLGGIWTSAKLIYDRHDVYSTLSDYQISIETRRAIYQDNYFKHKSCHIEITSFNGDLLITGTLPNNAYLTEFNKRIEDISGYKRLYRYVNVDKYLERTSLHDSWITAKIRSQIFADSDIDPDKFKIVTANGYVYILGDVIKSQGKIILDIASNTDGVIKVINLMHWYVLDKQ
jgi:osmotically-inducible protein OsmY